ncbi:DNA primase regulatory subunit PriL [Halolamina litorea]|uniref:DNA primase large subunit PriL n=1 Tax=Halolamina litorea TaxID=1515593 RepID=A0ABD6BVF9_9EURY|nr:DNA primase [Halolamina litorea]
MQPLHARYPFFDDAREAVGELGASVPELAASGDPAVERGRERVERALTEGTTAPEDPNRWSDEAELLSYPVARVLVSLLAEGKAVEKYAAAEAATAATRFADDVSGGDDGLRSTTDASVSLPRILREFDLDGSVREERLAGESQNRSAGATDRDWYRVAVEQFLLLTDDWGEDWRLVNRELAGGEVRTRRGELYGADGEGLLVEAVGRRVSEGLPFDLGDDRREGLEDALAEPLSSLRDLLGERVVVRDIDVVLPDLFPECIDELRQRAGTEELDDTEAFALLSFLAAIGLDAEEAVAFCADLTLDPRQVRYAVERLGEKRGAQYPTPSCETLEAYGICTNQNGHRERSDHPLVLYRERVRGTDPDERVDWRERELAQSRDAK